MIPANSSQSHEQGTGSGSESSDSVCFKTFGMPSAFC
jgi:hypothetical protein